MFTCKCVIEVSKGYFACQWAVRFVPSSHHCKSFPDDQYLVYEISLRSFFFVCLLGMFWFWKLWWRREHSLPPVGARGCPDWPFHCCHTVLVSREWQVDSTTQYLPILSVQRGFLSCFLLKWHKVLDAIWKSGSGVTCLKTVRNDVNFNSIYKYNEDTVYICFSPPLIFWG